MSEEEGPGGVKTEVQRRPPGTPVTSTSEELHVWGVWSQEGWKTRKNNWITCSLVRANLSTFFNKTCVTTVRPLLQEAPSNQSFLGAFGDTYVTCYILQCPN